MKRIFGKSTFPIPSQSKHTYTHTPKDGEQTFRSTAAYLTLTAFRVWRRIWPINHSRSRFISIYTVLDPLPRTRHTSSWVDLRLGLRVLAPLGWESACRIIICEYVIYLIKIRNILVRCGKRWTISDEEICLVCFPFRITRRVLLSCILLYTFRQHHLLHLYSAAEKRRASFADKMEGLLEIQ